MLELDRSQQKALQNITQMTNNIYILTGAPGYGKTFSILRIVKQIWEQNKVHPARTYFCTPTGKAAKVLQYALQPLNLSDNNQPKTIHRLLGCQGKDWIYNETNPLPADLVIVDESSMIESLLMARLFNSVDLKCVFILVGDPDQLFPVGAGAPFLDIIKINPGKCVNQLQENHRAAEGGMIAYATEQIKKGLMPTWGEPGKHTLKGIREDDLFYHNIEDKESIPDKIKQLVETWYKNNEDFMVLSPQRSGVCGVENINKELQAYLNPISPYKPSYKVAEWLTLNTGDKVINLKNNYELNIFNGFVGTILRIEYNTQNKFTGVLIDFDGEKVFIQKKADIKNLALAYCITIHKSQGSEYKKGVVVLHSSHYYMLNRSLMYVAVSRFKEELHIIGNKKGLHRALKNNIKGKRNTYLQTIK